MIVRVLKDALYAQSMFKYMFNSWTPSSGGYHLDEHLPKPNPIWCHQSPVWAQTQMRSRPQVSFELEAEKKNDNKRIMYIVLWTGIVSLCRRILTCTLIKPTNEVKKSIRSICFGTTHSTSISKFFMCTPRLKEPNWEIYPCVALATSLRIRCKSLLCLSPEIEV